MLKETISLLRNAATINTSSLNMIFMSIERQMRNLQSETSLKNHKLNAKKNRGTLNKLDFKENLTLAQKQTKIQAYKQLIISLDTIAKHTHAISFFQGPICALALSLIKLDRDKVLATLAMSGTPIPDVAQ